MNTYIGYTSVMKDGENGQEKEVISGLIYGHKRLRLELDKTVRRIITPICVGKCADGEPMHRVKAVWDTGSQISCISDRMARKLGLSTVDTGIGITATGKVNINYYEVDVEVSSQIAFPRVKVAGFLLENHDADFLIGMDIISKGNFCIMHEDEKMIFEFNT